MEDLRQQGFRPQPHVRSSRCPPPAERERARERERERVSCSSGAPLRARGCLCAQRANLRWHSPLQGGQLWHPHRRLIRWWPARATQQPKRYRSLVSGRAAESCKKAGGRGSAIGDEPLGHVSGHLQLLIRIRGGLGFARGGGGGVCKGLYVRARFYVGGLVGRMVIALRPRASAWAGTV